MGKIEAGKISLSAAAAIFPYARKPEGRELLGQVEGKTVREVEKLVAKLNPLPDVPRDVVRPIALALESPAAGAAPAEPQLAYRLSITLSDAGYEMLRRATDLLRHKHPDGAPHAIVEDALEALPNAVDRDRKEKPARALRPSAPRSCHIPEWVKDLVWRRDGGRCAFIARAAHNRQAARDAGLPAGPIDSPARGE